MKNLLMVILMIFQDRNLYELFCKFYNKINIDLVSDSDSDDSVNIEDILSGYEDSETDSD